MNVRAVGLSAGDEGARQLQGGGAGKLDDHRDGAVVERSGPGILPDVRAHAAHGIWRGFLVFPDQRAALRCDLHQPVDRRHRVAARALHRVSPVE